MIQINEHHHVYDAHHELVDHVTDFAKYGLDLLEHLKHEELKELDPDILHAYIGAIKCAVKTAGIVLEKCAK